MTEAPPLKPEWCLALPSPDSLDLAWILQQEGLPAVWGLKQTEERKKKTELNSVRAIRIYFYITVDPKRRPCILSCQVYYCGELRFYCLNAASHTLCAVMTLLWNHTQHRCVTNRKLSVITNLIYRLIFIKLINKVPDLFRYPHSVYTWF